MTIRDHEEKLFTKWAQRARKMHDPDMITKDGLLYRGELWFDGVNQAHRPANEEQLWNDAGMRLLVLSKELYDEDCWDIRSETGRVPTPHLTNRTAQRFFPNLELWVYGLMNIPDRKVMPFSRADNATRLQGFYENAPIARVVCKKQPDAKAASNAVMQKYMENYVDLLAEQIAMYRADIILCRLLALKQEADRSEAVVAADHGAIGVAHPAVIEVALAASQRFDKGMH